MKNDLIVNNSSANFFQELRTSLINCTNFDFTVAFVSMSGLQLLLDTFKTLQIAGVRGRIITSTYLNFTEPKAIRRLTDFSNISVRIFPTNSQVGFHTKGYLFGGTDGARVIVGSANLTQNALKTNKEWNIRVHGDEKNGFLKTVADEFEGLWNSSQLLDDDLINRYEEHYKEAHAEKPQRKLFEITPELRPNRMQELALDSFKRLRAQNQNKALAIAATGSGKTVMAALDVKSYAPRRVLFIVHREQILNGARVAFSKIIPERSSEMGLLTGTKKDHDKAFVFSTNLSMNNSLKDFAVDHFDYIVIDEAHHATSDTWRRILEHFRPKFLLGMTATPERSDGGDIFEFFDNNVAVELRLRGALEHDLVVPFHYFGISDETVDLHDLDLKDVDEIAKRLKINQRVDFVIDKMHFYGHDETKRKAIGFCVTQDHAAYMAQEFNNRGIVAVSLNANNTIAERERYVRRLEDENDELELIFTVDIFNEGVDIPSINIVLMLRPTNSPIVFVQQLGRGLRKTHSKQYLTVIDFIGNHAKTFLIAMALCGTRAYDKDSLMRAVSTDFSDIPGCTNIQLDEIAKERILTQIEATNFNSMRFLKEEYFEFKSLNGNRIPTLVDHVRFEGSPDPLKFIRKSRSYEEFVIAVDDLAQESRELFASNLNLVTLTRQLCNELPVKRPHEFAIIEHLLSHREVDLRLARSIISKYLDNPDDATILHTFNYLSGTYDDTSDRTRKLQAFEQRDGRLVTKSVLHQLLLKQNAKERIADIIRYGLLRYEEEFGNTNYGIPFLKLYQTYNGRNIALLSNYNLAHSSFRGSGLLKHENHRFLIVDLHKDESIDERINYKDKFTSSSTFQWQSPNATRQTSNTGLDLIESRSRGINLHLFVRKFREIDRVTQPFIYLGTVERYEEPKGEQPITIQFMLTHTVPPALYDELTS